MDVDGQTVMKNR